MEYKVKTTLGGKRRVAFTCAACRADLEAPLEEAGQRFPCPTCGRPLVTPGDRELEQLRREEQARLKREADEKAAEHQRAVEEAERREAAKAEKLRAEEARRAAKQSQPRTLPKPRRHVSLTTFALTLVLAAVLAYLLAIVPLQKRLSRVEANLSALTKAVNENAIAAQANLDSLRTTVNHNAEAANHTSNRVNELATSVLDIARIAENANRHAHSHTRF